MCGIGLLVGSYITYDVLPAIGVGYANSGFSQMSGTLRQIFYGIGLGLALGILIRRASAIGTLAVLGPGIYLITRALNQAAFNLSQSWEEIIRGALIGFVLGYAYEYVRRGKETESKPHAAKSKLVWVAIISFLAITISVIAWLSLSPPLTPYYWGFDQGPQGWGAPGKYMDISVPKIKDGYLTFASTGNDPQLTSHAALRIVALATPIITIRMRVTGGQGYEGQIFFITTLDPNWDETKSVVFTLDGDGTFGTYNILMSENPAWRDVITEIRVDPVNDPSGTNLQFAIDYISVHAP
jgi:hypothetical protein